MRIINILLILERERESWEKENKELREKLERLEKETLSVREVKNDAISSLWIMNETNESSDELIEKVINIKYKIEEYLGKGRFGKVFKVLDLNENNA